MSNENEFYRKASMCVCGNLDIEKAMWHCLMYINRFMPADAMILALSEHGLGAIRLIAAAVHEDIKKDQLSNFSDVFSDLMNKLDQKHYGKLNLILPLSTQARTSLDGANLPEIRIANRPELDPVNRQIAKYFGTNNWSSIVMFLSNNGERLGAVAIASLGRDKYQHEHLKLFSLLNEPFTIALSNALRHQELLSLKERLIDDNRYLNQELQSQAGPIIGTESGLKEVMNQVQQVAPLKTPVLLLGETGVGKEIIANTIHRFSSRASGPFIKVNCGAFPPTLLDSELFGHEKGAFSGANASKRGRFERAHNGTLFLDEIGEMTPDAQIRLLRVLQTGEIERVGGTKTHYVDTRIIAATHRDLKEMVKRKTFREDLWFRLNVFPVLIPPLRKRKEDIPRLIDYFIRIKGSEFGLHNIPRIGPSEIDRLIHYNWPGNVRELANTIERALILCKGDLLTFGWMTEREDSVSHTEKQLLPNESLNLDDVIIKHIRRVLQMTQGKVHGPDGAAQLMGINSNTLRNRMDKLGIHFRKKGNV